MTDNQKRLIHLAIIILLPLLPALLIVGYNLYLIPAFDIDEWFGILIFSAPSALIIYYGYATGNKVVATLCGALLLPLVDIYTGILLELFDPEFIMAGLNYWLRWRRIINYAPFTLICGLMGYFASRRTKASLLASVLLGILFVFIMASLALT